MTKLSTTAAVLERERVVGECERRIGRAVHVLTVTEALPVSEVAEPCGLDVREVNRLLRAGPPLLRVGARGGTVGGGCWRLRGVIGRGGGSSALLSRR